MIRVGENVGDDVLIALISGTIACPCCAGAWSRSAYGGAVDLKRGRLLSWERDGKALVRVEDDRGEVQTLRGEPDGLWPAWMDDEAGTMLRARLGEFGVPEPMGRVQPPSCPAVAWASQPGWYPMKVSVLEWMTSADEPEMMARVRTITQDDSDPWLVERVYWTEADAKADR